MKAGGKTDGTVCDPGIFGECVGLRVKTCFLFRVFAAHRPGDQFAEVIPNIPRFYTALAELVASLEWLLCCLFHGKTGGGR